jgi:hypothetical protein
LAAFCQGHALGASREQVEAHLLFELADLPRERRLRQVETLGGTAEMQFLSHDDKGLELTELHSTSVLADTFVRLAELGILIAGTVQESHRINHCEAKATCTAFKRG